jgi:hypothetical protein
MRMPGLGQRGRIVLAFAPAAVLVAWCVYESFPPRDGHPGEAHYIGRPTSWWAGEILHWDKVIGRYSIRAPRPDERLAPAGEGGLMLLLGDPRAIPVLTELLEDLEPAVRSFAGIGLERYGRLVRGHGTVDCP